MDWTEIIIRVPADDVDIAGDIANMTVPYGIYIEDYRYLEKEVMEIANIDLIDEELLKKDRSVGIVHIYISPEDNPQEAVQFLAERFSAEKIKHEIELAVCKNKDWENNWKAHFHPMPIGEKLLIRPIWQELADTQGRMVLDLEPGMAFGTGTHETTRLCIEALEPYVNSQSKVLDIGCGSGILSIASLLLGAKEAVGVDIDKIAVRTARENGERNGFVEPEYKIIHGSFTHKVTGQFDLVLANIVADAIIELSKNVRQFMNTGGVYIVSGIIDLREKEVKAALEENGFEIVSRFEDGGWICFVCR